MRKRESVKRNNVLIFPITISVLIFNFAFIVSFTPYSNLLNVLHTFSVKLFSTHAKYIYVICKNKFIR